MCSKWANWEAVLTALGVCGESKQTRGYCAHLAAEQRQAISVLEGLSQ